MILEIPTLVSRLLPGLFRTGPLHVARVQTTRAKFLVFDSNPDRPACVVQFGSGEELSRLHGILCRLHGKLPDVVSESLVCQPWCDGEYVHIQAGLSGAPWFRLEERFSSPQAWDWLRVRASEVLSRLHAVVRDFPEWSSRVCPAEELRCQAVVCQARGVVLSRRASAWVDACATGLDDLGEVMGFAQHGDFCLNNLLVSASGLALIDFDEFARTSVPLHDEIGLALSFQHFAPRGGRLLPPPKDLAGLLRNCRPEGLDLHAHLPGLFLHHLLWRINQTHDWSTRAGVRSELVTMVEEFAAAPDNALPSGMGEMALSYPFKPPQSGVP